MLKKLLFLPLLFLLWCIPARAQTPTLVQTADCNSTSGSFTVTDYKCFWPNPTISGNTILCGIGYASTGSHTITVSDDKSDTWVNDGSNNNTSSIVAISRASNIASGGTWVNVHLSATTVGVSMGCSEFFNITATTPLDGSVCIGSATSTAVSCSTTIGASGDILFAFYIQDSTGSPITSWTAPAGYIALWQDLHDSLAAQYQVLSAANKPTATIAPSEEWNIIGAAYKPGSQGSGPAAGIHVNSVQHNAILNTTATFKSQFVSSGNGGVLLWIGTNLADITAVSGTVSGSWTQATFSGSSGSGNNHICEGSTGSSGDAQVWYNTNLTSANTGKSDVLTVTFGGTHNANSTLFMFDLSGTNTSTFLDNAVCANGTMSSGTTQAMVSITPTNTNEIILTQAPVATCEATAVSPGTQLMTITNPIFGSGALDENNGWALEYKGGSTASSTYTWTATNIPGGCSNHLFGEWANLAAAFESPAASGPPANQFPRVVGIQ